MCLIHGVFPNTISKARLIWMYAFNRKSKHCAIYISELFNPSHLSVQTNNPNPAESLWVFQMVEREGIEGVREKSEQQAIPNHTLSLSISPYLSFVEIYFNICC